MRTFKPALSGKGLLAASVALLSGQVLAEDAGRVSYVNGDVTASSPDGSSRLLHKGDLINGGDKISTRAGRIQIRFTDGGFVSLQPNTVFGVDQYLYANRKPEETSLFFSLLQGGMRTITGAIGKVNKQSYKVRTPVATIGIRGTEYLASVNDLGLIVSVGSGFVNVANDNGEITGGAGQNLFVPPGGVPGLGDEPADVHAGGTGGDHNNGNQSSSGNNDANTGVGDVQNGRGDYIFLFTTQGQPLPDSNLQTGTPAYYFTSPGYSLITGSARAGAGVLATFDQTGVTTGAVGALLNAWLTSPADPALPDFDATGMQAVNVATVGNLSWGEYTNGVISNNKLFDTCGDGCTSPITLSSTQFLPYIIGTPAMSNLSHGVASYSLQGGTAPRDASGQAGTLNFFKVDVNLDFATMNLAMQVTMPGSGQSPSPDTYDVKTTGGKPVGVFNLGTANTFMLGSSDLVVTDTGGSCVTSGSGSCSASIQGFFSGTGAAQIGASYQIDNFSSPVATGVAGLGLSGYNPAPGIASGTGYSSAYSVSGSTGFSGGYNYGSGSDYSLNVQFDGAGALQTATSFSSPVYDRAAALADDVGSAGTLTWGRWYSTAANGDTVTAPTGLTAPTVVTAVSPLHYIVGPMTQPNIFAGISALYPNGASATYTYQGGTTATGTDGTTGTVAANSTVTVNFGTTSTLAVDLGINMRNGTTSIGNYQITGSGIAINPQSSANFSAGGSGSLSVSGTACGSAGACSASIQGFFAGQQAQQVGLGYEVKDINRTVNGVAAFGRGGLTGL